MKLRLKIEILYHHHVQPWNCLCIHANHFTHSFVNVIFNAEFVRLFIPRINYSFCFKSSREAILFQVPWKTNIFRQIITMFKKESSRLKP